MEQLAVERLQAHLEPVVGLHGGNRREAENLAERPAFMKIHRAGDGRQTAHRCPRVAAQIEHAQQPAHAVAEQIHLVRPGVLAHPLHHLRQPLVHVGVQVQVAVGLGRLAPVDQIDVVAARHQVTDHGPVGHQVVGPAVDAQRRHQNQRNTMLLPPYRYLLVADRNPRHRRQTVMTQRHDAVAVNFVPGRFVGLNEAPRMTAALHHMAQCAQ